MAAARTTAAAALDMARTPAPLPALGALTLAAVLASIVTAWMFWTRCPWGLRLVLIAIPAIFTFSLNDVRDLFRSYDQYRARWRREHDRNTRRRGSS